ncbi:hypothetical protein V6N11_041110 [Hibiscus sabdariffa]|uniref:Uncharacterized protein n=1 Tax=Hibiscus sabdariffa TaxID=183260 RepID=A0ABR2RJX2_9ROSI
MSDPKDKPTLEKPSSTKQQSPKGNNFLIEKSDGGDDVIGGDEGQNKIVDVAAAAAAAPVSGSSSSRPVIFGSRKRGRIDSEAGADVVNDGFRDVEGDVRTSESPSETNSGSFSSSVIYSSQEVSRKEQSGCECPQGATSSHAVELGL